MAELAPDEDVVQLRPAAGPHEVRLSEALVVLPGDHLIVRIAREPVTLEEADVIRMELRSRFPGLGGVTVIAADGLAVYRPEVSTDG